MNTLFRLPLAMSVCALTARSVCAQSPVKSPASRTHLSPKVQELVNRTEAMWQQILKNQKVKVHIQRALPPPMDFDRAQHQLEAALKQYPNATDQVALQNSLADLHSAWGKYWDIYGGNSDWVDYQHIELTKAQSHYWRAYSSDRVLRPEKAFEDQSNVAGCTYDDEPPQKRKAAIWMLRGVVAHYRETKNFPAQADALFKTGGFYYSLNRWEEAMRCYKEADALYSKGPDHLSDRGFIWLWLGSVYLERGEYADALDAYQVSAKFQQSAHEVEGEINCCASMGWIYLSSLNQPDKAIPWFERGEKLRLRYPHDQGIQRSSMGVVSGLGYVQVKLKNYPKALSIYTNLLAETRKNNNHDTSTEAASLLDIGDIYLRMKRYAEAARYGQMAATRYREMSASGAEGLCLCGVGLCYMNLGRSAEALRFLNRALQLNHEAHDVYGEADILGALCSLYAQKKQPKVAILYGKQAVNIIQSFRRHITTLDQSTKDAFLKSNEEIYQKLARLLIDEGRYNEADKVFSMLKQNEFDQFIRRSSRGPQMEQLSLGLTAQEKPVAAEENRLLDNISQLSAEEWTLEGEKTPTPQQKARLKVVQDKLKEIQANTEAFFGGSRWLSQRDNSTNVNSLGDTQDLLLDLGGHVAQVSTFLDDKGLDLVLTLPKGPSVHLSYPAADAKTGGKPFKEWLRTRIYDFVKAIEAGATTDNSVDVNNRATELNNILSCHGALHNQLQGADTPITTVMWRLTDVLCAIPLAALRDKDGYWVEKYQSVLLNESSEDGDDKLRDEPQANWKALGLGVTKAWTIKGEQFPALSGVKGELQAVVNAPSDGFSGGALPGHVLEDSNFNEQSFFDSLRGTTSTAPAPWQVIHIASHFKVSDDASESYLLLGDGQTLTLLELRDRASMKRLFRGVDLVTLSACQTAQGTDSLGTIVVEKGAKSVIATLWPVSDKETAQLMGDFYSTYANNRSKGGTKADALQHAQLALIHSGTASARPYYWAPFVLMGNWK